MPALQTPETVIEALLAPLERRPTTRSTPEIGQARADYAIGLELARIQGATPSPLRARLRELVIRGQATPQEVMGVATEFARQGLLSRNETAGNDR